jgi:dTDP-4-dehydrorhamnose reductase
MKHVLILGAKGTLGGQLRPLFSCPVCWDREDVDVTDFALFRRKVMALDPRPEAVINCVAFNDVDGAEDRPKAAFALNAEFVGRLAGLTRELAVPLVHYSTNYVFDGAKGEYVETDRPAPLSVYGQSKYRGEQLLAENADAYYLLRTAVIFGPKGESELSKKSFIEQMLDLSGRFETIKAVADEINSITYAVDLAAATRYLLHERKPYGIYHAANSGLASWYDLAEEVFRIAGKSTRLIAVPSTEFPRKARRPAKAVLINTRMPVLRPWQQAVEAFLAKGAGNDIVYS